MAWTEREATLLVLVLLYGVLVAWLMPYELVQDSWLTLVGGREIAANGLPTHDTLAVMTKGVAWIEQQWGAKLAFYGLHELGGIQLVVFAHAALVVSAFAAAVAAARRLGASREAVYATGFVSMFLAPWGWQMRSQTFALPLFAATLWLLASDSRKPSARVLLTIPILVVWANVHGSVLLGAALLMLRGVTIALERRPTPAPSRARLRAGALVAAPPMCLFASPYAFALVDYYRSLVLNPAIGRFIDEWQPSTFPSDWPFFAAAAVAIWVTARASSLTTFEKVALLVTTASALTATRNTVWFALTVVVVVPRALDEAWRFNRFAINGAGRLRPLVWMSRGLFLALATLVGVTLFVRDGIVDRLYPREAAEAVAAAAREDPSMNVLVSERYADWLLWQKPQLAGRIAYDVRFELFTEQQFRLVSNFRSQVGDWKRLAAGYRLIVLDRETDRAAETAFLDERGVRLLYRDQKIVVVLRAASATPRPAEVSSSARAPDL